MSVRPCTRLLISYSPINFLIVFGMITSFISLVAGQTIRYGMQSVFSPTGSPMVTINDLEIIT